MSQEIEELIQTVTFMSHKLENLELRLKNLENQEGVSDDDWGDDGTDPLIRKLSSLYGYIRVFRSDTIRDQKKNETYLKLLTKEIYDIQQSTDFLRAYIQRQIEWDEED